MDKKNYDEVGGKKSNQINKKTKFSNQVHIV